MAQEQHGSTARRNWNIRLRIGLLLVSCIMLSYYFADSSGMIPASDSMFNRLVYMQDVFDSSKTTPVYMAIVGFEDLWFHSAIGLGVIALFPLPFSWYTWLFFLCYVLFMSSMPVI